MVEIRVSSTTLISIFFALQEERRRLKNAIIIQSFVRGYRDRKHQVCTYLFIYLESCKTVLLQIRLSSNK